MATEYPPLNKIYVFGYSANDRDYPILSATADPRVAGYQVPKDLSACPDKRYPNHVFTGAQPISGDQRVRHVWEILPSPWVPFTRYDDDLGPIQGRRRFVKNDGQVASLTADKRTTYEAREGSAIVYNELEETWSIATDEDGNSLFPIRDRDFYDERLGPVQERRQLISATGEEQASLVYNAPTITQIDYEPYNEFLVFKIVRTYTLAGPIRNENAYDPSRGNISRTSQAVFDDKNHKATLTEVGGVVTQTSFQAINTLVADKIVETYTLNGPLLVGKATDGDKQIATITTQRKAAAGYAPPELTATTSVEASREDAATIVERVTEIPEVFSAVQVQTSKPDIIPAKFRVAIPDVEIAQSLAGQASTPQLDANDISASAVQQDKFVVRVSKRSREVERKEITSTQFTGELGGGEAEVKETLIPANSPQEEIELDLGLISSRIEDLGDGTLVKEVVRLKNEGSLPVLTGQEYDEALDIVVPYSQKFVKADDETSTTGERKQVNPRDVIHSAVREYDFEQIENTLDNFYWALPDMMQISLPDILRSVKVVYGFGNASSEASGVGDSFTYSVSKSSSTNGGLVYDIEQGFSGTIPAIRAVFFLKKSESTPQKVLEVVQAKSGVDGFFPNVRPESHSVTILGSRKEESDSESVSYSGSSISESDSYSISVETASIPPTIHGEIIITEEYASIGGTGNAVTTGRVSPTSLGSTQFPLFPTGKYLYSIGSSPFRFGYTRIEAVILDITSEYVTPKESGA